MHVPYNQYNLSILENKSAHVFVQIKVTLKNKILQKVLTSYNGRTLAETFHIITDKSSINKLDV